jgi:hypothetical protein
MLSFAIVEHFLNNYAIQNGGEMMSVPLMIVLTYRVRL